jgi:hypothetical protein
MPLHGSGITEEKETIKQYKGELQEGNKLTSI